MYTITETATLVSGLYHGRQMLVSKLTAFSSSCKQKTGSGYPKPAFLL